VPGASPGDVPVNQRSFPAGRRQRLIRKTAGMTSDDAENHLVGFGEWAALYLLSWTGRLKNRTVDGTKPLWPDKLAVIPAEHDASGAPTALDPNAEESPIETLLTPLYSDLAKPLLDGLLDTFMDERDAVVKIGDDGDKVRRALANIPVLTICDDHEVTDDWFITGAWRARVLTSTLGRAMVRNALVAYVLFQAWGNTPEPFDKDTTPEGKLLALIPSLFSGATVPDPEVCTEVDKLLGLDDPTGQGTSERVTFNYHVDLAGGRLVVLDTRTHREYRSPDGPPGLLTQAALDAQLPISLTDDVPLLIVVSPAPVLGPRLIEETVAPLSTRWYDFTHMAFHWAGKVNVAADDAAGVNDSASFGELFYDMESWGAQPPAFERFLNRVSRCPQVVILAGDVHYAASYAMDYQRFDVPTDEGGVPPADPPPHSSSSRIVHFTSSALCNGYEPKVAAFVRSIGIAEHLEQIGYEGARMGWTRMTPPVMTGGDIAAGEARPLRARMRREPVMLPTVGWKARHAVRPPEWAYQVTTLSDTRTDDVRFHDLATAGFTQVLGPDVPDAPPPPLDGSNADSWVGPGGPYEVATALHAANVDGGAVTRTLVFANNIGVVTFNRDGPDAPLSVQMAIYFVRAHPVSDDEKPHAYVVHAASLAQTPLAAPDHVGGA
jgi:hypothetical protein